MKTKNLLFTFAILFIALISGCAKDDFEEIEGVCPVVLSTDPDNGTINVPLDKTITVIFNEEMNAATFNQSSFTLQGTTAVAGTVSFSGTTASFDPTSPLAANTTYTGVIKTSVKDIMGNALQADYVWTFSTGSTVTPMVISTDPANNATNVFLNKIVTANFNMPMNQATINATTFTLKQGTTTVTGSVSYNGTTANFAPTAPLATNTIYTGTITTGVKNVQGTTIASSYTWTFTTGSVTAPNVTATDPADNASGVALNKNITATFSMAMDPLTISNTTFTLKNGSAIITGTVSYLGTTATFNPDSDLLPGTTYTAAINTTAKNVAGVSLANDYVWNFSTNSAVVGNTVNLGSAERFGIIAGVGVSNNAGFSIINNMDVGISPGVRSSITGFPPAVIVNGAIYASDDIAPVGIAAMLTQAKLDLTNAYLFAEGASYSAPITVSGDQGGKTLVAGIYKSTSTLLVQNGDLTLSGSATDVWIFQVASAFTTVGGAGGNIKLTGGALAKNVFWQTGSSATIGDYTSFVGNVLALQSITMGSHSTAQGRMLARNGAVVMTHTNIITKP
ncbi:Ig-like domain-containing protein [Flavobacterium yafengii]|uniref:Ig-like domain-containing protein n=1 Tax=Flavobacterium yafengii TaxID=3041253 RepID=A0AAW6TRL2_9FLAO|nr:Ig-like domain-containing protein [Flavobacterium yafengii]MDI5950143.1 Ig-like domain-containing protein [Flavobacterium yafengii]